MGEKCLRTDLRCDGREGASILTLVSINHTHNLDNLLFANALNPFTFSVVDTMFIADDIFCHFIRPVRSLALFACTKRVDHDEPVKLCKYVESGNEWFLLSLNSYI